jgi:hypothetical protein
MTRHRVSATEAFLVGKAPMSGGVSTDERVGIFLTSVDFGPSRSSAISTIHNLGSRRIEIYGNGSETNNHEGKHCGVGTGVEGEP